MPTRGSSFTQSRSKGNTATSTLKLVRTPGKLNAQVSTQKVSMIRELTALESSSGSMLPRSEHSNILPKSSRISASKIKFSQRESKKAFPRLSTTCVCRVCSLGRFSHLRGWTEKNLPCNRALINIFFYKTIRAKDRSID